MVEGANKLMCGNCGKEKFSVFAQGKGVDYKLIIECSHCKSTTVVESQKPTLKVEFGEDSQGILCYKCYKD